MCEIFYNSFFYSKYLFEIVVGLLLQSHPRSGEVRRECDERNGIGMDGKLIKIQFVLYFDEWGHHSRLERTWLSDIVVINPERERCGSIPCLNLASVECTSR